MNGKGPNRFEIAATELPPFRSEAVRTCPECGKEFSWRQDWGYGIGSVDYCSWACVRNAEKRGEAKTYGRVSPFADHLDEITERVRNGEPLRAIAIEYGRTASTLYAWLGKSIGFDERSELMRLHHEAMMERRNKNVEDTNQSPKRSNHTPGVKNGPLKDDLIDEIKRLAAQGLNSRQIAAVTGCSESSARKYANQDRAEKPSADIEEAPVPAKTDLGDHKAKPDRRDFWKAVGTLEAIFKADLFDDHREIAEAALAVIEEAWA